MLEGHFWYSEKQAETIQHMGHYHTNYCQLDNGKIVVYTEMANDNHPNGKWEDYKYLGHGFYHHTAQ